MVVVVPDAGLNTVDCGVAAAAAVVECVGDVIDCPSRRQVQDDAQRGS